MKLISQGAEAKIFIHKNIIEKQRIPKNYRHPLLDTKIRVRRTKAEAKILTRAFKAEINVPKLIKIKKYTLEMEFIDGDRLSETLNSYSKKKQIFIMQKLGEQLSKLHKNNIIHNDLTTSNTIFRNEEIFLIDFGLSYISTKIEDKAVDLHLIKQALKAKHFENWENLFGAFKKKYKFEESKKIIERLLIVEKRGRYKH